MTGVDALVGGVGPVVLGLLADAGGSVGLSGPAMVMLAIALLCVVLWITTPVPPAYTGLLCISLIGVGVSTDVAFVGFRSPAVWLIVAGLVIGEATRRSGLADWIGRLITRLVPDDARTETRPAYRWLLLLTSLAGLALTLLVPSSLVRVLILLPVLDRIGRSFDSSRARTGVVLGPAIVTFFASPGILTAGLPNIITTGILEAAGGPQITWTTWALQLFPLMGVGRSVLIAGVAYWLFRPAPNTAVSFDSPAAGAGRSSDDGRSSSNAPGAPATDDSAADVSTQGTGPGTERRMLLFLAVGTAVWATDFLHGLHPVYGALLVAILATVPRVGVVDFSVVGDVDFTIVFFLGAVFAIGEGLQRTGFVDVAAQAMLDLIPGSAGFLLVLALVFCVTVALTFLIEGLAVASVLTPLLVSYANTAGLPLEPVIMIEAVALGTYFFPYQSAVLVGILAEDVVETGDLIRIATASSIVTTVVLLPFQLALFGWMY